MVVCPAAHGDRPWGRADRFGERAPAHRVRRLAPFWGYYKPMTNSNRYHEATRTSARNSATRLGERRSGDRRADRADAALAEQVGCETGHQGVELRGDHVAVAGASGGPERQRDRACCGSGIERPSLHD
jgi:hypothetical protein